MSELQYMPLLNVEYFKRLNESSNGETLNAIKISLMMVSGFQDIMNHDKYDRLTKDC